MWHKKRHDPGGGVRPAAYEEDQEPLPNAKGLDSAPDFLILQHNLWLQTDLRMILKMTRQVLSGLKGQIGFTIQTL